MNIKEYKVSADFKLKNSPTIEIIDDAKKAIEKIISITVAFFFFL